MLKLESEGFEELRVNREENPALSFFARQTVELQHKCHFIASAYSQIALRPWSKEHRHHEVICTHFLITIFVFIGDLNLTDGERSLNHTQPTHSLLYSRNDNYSWFFVCKKCCPRFTSLTCFSSSSSPATFMYPVVGFVSSVFLLIF